jgi:hypothetical protein
MVVLPRKHVSSQTTRAAARTSRAGACTAFAVGLCAVLAIGLLGCDTILGMQPLAISNWHPHEARLNAAAVGEIWVEFSANVDRVKAEQAFSLSENGAAMSGRFSWSGNRLTFAPDKSVSTGNDYEMAVLTTAESTEGNSLVKDFRFAFSTKNENGRPTIVAVQPADGSRVSGAFLPVTVIFSEPIDPTSFIAAFSVSPDPGGTIAFTSGGSTAVFTPLTPWKQGTEYRVTISDTVKDLSGNRLAAALRLRFITGAEAVRPTLLAVRQTVNGVTQGAGLIREDPSDGVPQINGGFEATWGIELQFSEPVARENIESFIEFQPSWVYQIDPSCAPRDHFLLVPRERFLWGALYNLTVKRGVVDMSGNASSADASFFFRVDGPCTRPPKVEQIRFRKNPADPSGSAAYATYTIVDAFANLDLSAFSPSTELVTYLDIYLSLASGASIDPFSLMSSFSVTATNGAALFTPIAVTVAAFPEPQPVVVPGLTPARVSVRVTNTTSSGVVTLGVSENLTDTAGNRMTGAFNLPLLK